MNDYELAIKQPYYKNLVFLQENEEIFYTEKSFVLKNKKEYEFSIIPISEKIEKLT